MNFMHNSELEGIDTISFRVKTPLVNKILWHHPDVPGKKTRQTVAPYITVRVEKSKYDFFYYCDIQYEALDMNKNLLSQVAKALYILVKRRLVILPSKCNGREAFYCFYYIEYIIELAAVDFFFDFSYKNAIFPNVSSRFDTTYYSSDHKNRKSLWCKYDRNRKFKDDFLRKGGGKLTQTDYPMRTELRLRRSNCDYMNLYNLDGNYQSVFSLYEVYIVKSWRKHGNEIGGNLCDSQHQNFLLVQALAGIEEKLRISEFLRKTPKRRKAPLNIIRKRVDTDLIDIIMESISSGEDDFHSDDI